MGVARMAQQLRMHEDVGCVRACGQIAPVGIDLAKPRAGGELDRYSGRRLHARRPTAARLELGIWLALDRRDKGIDAGQ
jgi:hypothetical protein